MSKPSIRLIHWHAGEAGERARIIRGAGYDVVYALDDLPGLRGLRENPPAACVIDLGRVPSHGRDIAVRIRQYKATRGVPLIFVDGIEEKVARVRELLPDAIYTTWSRIGSAIEEALSSPPVVTSVPGSAFGAFAGTPLLKKLGIDRAMRLAIVNAPDDFDDTLGELPDGVGIERRVRADCDLVLWFVRSLGELAGDIEWMRENIGRKGIWIIYPKKSASPASDLTQAAIREIGNSAGMSDYKVCAVDAVWTGMRFAVRKDAR